MGTDADAGSENPRADGKIRVLLVEDDPLFTDLVVGILAEASEDFEVVSVFRLSTALAALVRDEMGLIVTDLNLPDSSCPVRMTSNSPSRPSGRAPTSTSSRAGSPLIRWSGGCG
jgi:hypothetical protein